MADKSFRRWKRNAALGLLGIMGYTGATAIGTYQFRQDAPKNEPAIIHLDEQAPQQKPSQNTYFKFGAYGDKANINRAVQKIIDEGETPILEQVHTRNGDLTRVMISHNDDDIEKARRIANHLDTRAEILIKQGGLERFIPFVDRVEQQYRKIERTTLNPGSNYDERLCYSIISKKIPALAQQQGLGENAPQLVNLYYAVLKTESHFKRYDVSGEGAAGYAQLHKPKLLWSMFGKEFLRRPRIHRRADTHLTEQQKQELRRKAAYLFDPEYNLTEGARLFISYIGMAQKELCPQKEAHSKHQHPLTRDAIRYGLAMYNAGPTTLERRFEKNEFELNADTARSGYQYLPRETQKYLNKLEKPVNGLRL